MAYDSARVNTGALTVSRDDPRYFDLAYFPTPDPGQHWAHARIEQVAAIKARQAEARRRRPAARQGIDILGIVERAGSIRYAFPELLPIKPYCVDYLPAPLRIRPRKLALRHRNIQLNHRQITVWMPFDVDWPGAYYAAEDADLPRPNFVAENPDNGHAHLAYLLRTPIARFEASRRSPIRWLAAIERGMRRRLKADTAYPGLLAKNPLHPDWRVEWLACQPYDLDDLGDALSREDMRPQRRREQESGASANCIVFDHTRDWAYRNILAFKRAGGTVQGWRERCHQIAAEFNAVFDVPMRDKEARLIGKSVADWTWRKFTDEAFSEVQQMRVQRRWAGHEALSKTEPWKAMGISRRTYYRHKKRNGQAQADTIPYQDTSPCAAGGVATAANLTARVQERATRGKRPRASEPRAGCPVIPAAAVEVCHVAI